MASIALSNPHALLGGLIGSLYEWMGPVNFWLANTAISLTGALAALLLGPAIRRALTATTSHPSSEIGAHA